MLIITGTGRSGTGTMARLMGGHHEFRANYILERHFLGAAPCTDPFVTFEKRVMVMLDLHQGVERATFIDSSNLYIYFIDALYLLNPGIKIVLTVRDGRDFVRSAYSRQWHERNAFGTVPLPGDRCLTIWDSMTPIQKNAWIWTFRNSKALEGLRCVPEAQKLIVRIEDLQQSGTLEALEAFTGKKISERDTAGKKHNANPAFSLPPKEEWDECQRDEFNAVAGEMMRYFGYE